MSRRTISGGLAALVLIGMAGLAGLSLGRVTAQTGPIPSPVPEDGLALARSFSGGNADWTPVIQTFDGIEMVLVPAGCFRMGSEVGEADQQPVHEVCFEEPFWLDRTEVTNGQFAAFNGQAENASYFPGDDRPREQITWIEAAAFCESRGARLPTEAEWEYAARGPDGWLYPWGNRVDATHALGFHNALGRTVPVGSIPYEPSWVGAVDLIGNVWEWVADWYGVYPQGPAVNPGGPVSGEYRVLRGGSWYRSPYADIFRATDRTRYAPQNRDGDFGFRCARSIAADAPPITPAEPVPSPIPFDPETASVPAGAHNADWSPIIRAFDGVDMVLVPAGCFLMGDEKTTVLDDIRPVHRVCFEEPFWIDRTEVTNGQFAAFDGQAASPSAFSGENRPRETITWAEAAAFCESRGARLPTEAEWEYAARGPDALTYPWGNVWDETRLIWNRTAQQGTADVGSRPGGAAWVGALDLGGNVWEWVADWYSPTLYATRAAGAINPPGPAEGQYRVARGGGWSDFNAGWPSTYYRQYAVPSLGYDFFGFRCARPVETDVAPPVLPATPMPTHTPFPLEAVRLPDGARNADWTSVIRDFDGVEMVLVPAGCFWMGDDASDNAYERPVHRVCFEEPFWIDRTEVTNAQFAAFDGQAEFASFFAGDTLPREQIAWEEAAAFCASRGARLPTEAEWEYAARGPDSLVYPWGNTFACRLANMDDETRLDPDVIDGVAGCDGFEETAPVGSFPEGVAWVGALDLIGNVGEWVADWFGPYPAEPQVNPGGPAGGQLHVVRGGSWVGHSRPLFRAAFRGYVEVGSGGSRATGFRCARALDE